MADYPLGMEDLLKPQELADIIAYVSNVDRPRRIFEGNNPTVVVPGTDGVLQLWASGCEMLMRGIAFWK